jgi:hypothetical protein
MKIRLLLATSALTLALSACASSGNTMASAASVDDGYDHAYMATVERSARNFGAQLIWVNPPEAKKLADQHE